MVVPNRTTTTPMTSNSTAGNFTYKGEIMKQLLLIIIILGILTGSGMAKKRVNGEMGKTSDQELGDKLSPSYVPFPYPTKRKEIIADLKYAIRYMYGGKLNTLREKKGTRQMVFYKLLTEAHDIKIGRIITLKNKIKEFHDDYTFLITITDQKKKPLLYTALLANGQLIGCVARSSNQPLFPIYTKKEVTDLMEKRFQFKEKSIKIKRAEPIYVRTSIPAFYPFSPPVWEIECSNGELYFLAPPYQRKPVHRIYRRDSQIPIRDTESFHHEARARARVPGEAVISDEDAQTMLILKEVK